MQTLFNLLAKLYANVIGQGSQWFWSMAQSMIVLGSLIFIYRQIKIQRYSNMLQMLNNMRENWNSERMMPFRKTTCTNYQKGTKKIGMAEGEVLGFFEEMGFMLKKGVVDKDFIWETYSYFIEHYWSMLESNIKEFRLSTRDNSWFKNFESLRDSVRKYSEKKRCPSSDKTEEEIERFICGELETFSCE